MADTKYWYPKREIALSTKIGGVLHEEEDKSPSLPEVGTKMIVEVNVWIDKADQVQEMNAHFFNGKNDRISTMGNQNYYYEVEVTKKLIPRTGFVDA